MRVAARLLDISLAKSHTLEATLGVHSGYTHISAAVSCSVRTLGVLSHDFAPSIWHLGYGKTLNPKVHPRLVLGTTLVFLNQLSLYVDDQSAKAQEVGEHV